MYLNTFMGVFTVEVSPKLVRLELQLQIMNLDESLIMFHHDTVQNRIGVLDPGWAIPDSTGQWSLDKRQK